LKSRFLTACLALAGLFTAAAVPAGNQYNNTNHNYVFDDEQPWSEQDYQIPAYPAKPNWQEFFLSPRAANRQYLDLGSLAVGQDGVVRYVLRIESPSGVQNVSLEGIRCQGRQVRSYAFGDTVHQRWIEAMKVVWRTIDHDDFVRKQLRESLCPEGSPVKDAGEAAKRLAATR
jgi:hypothetical protein